jgi:DNA (cytosine-5)-methyltransferase 1
MAVSAARDADYVAPRLTVGSLFSGIGGLDLGLERAGMEVRWQCEINPFCRQILMRHWPSIPCYEDVRNLPYDDIEAVDVLVGGFPCQPVSDAGKRLVQDDARWLWPAFADAVRRLRPSYVVMENVARLVNRGLDSVLGDLASLGYDCEWDCIPAAAVGAPHPRDRFFAVAYPSGRLEPQQPQCADAEALLGAGVGAGRRTVDRGTASGVLGPIGDAADGEAVRPRVFRGIAPHPRWESEPDVARMVHGLPQRVDRTKALGNAVVPAQAEFVGRLIVAAHIDGKVGGSNG